MNCASAAERLKKFEGSTSYMYRCTGGEVTVGVGHAIFDATHAAQIAWTGAPSPALIAGDFARVAAADKGLVATRYENLTQCRLGADAIEGLLLSDIEAFEKNLTASLPEWRGYPEPAQQGALRYGLQPRGGRIAEVSQVACRLRLGRLGNGCHRVPPRGYRRCPQPGDRGVVPPGGGRLKDRDSCRPERDAHGARVARHNKCIRVISK